MKSNRIAISSALMIVALVGSARAAGPVPTIPFTAQQAAQGKLAYIRACSRCHGGNLEGSVAIPSLNPGFIQRWQGGDLDSAIDYIRYAMPLDKPGTLDQPTGVAIMAYMLRVNGYEPGPSPMPTERAALKEIPLLPYPAGQ